MNPKVNGKCFLVSVCFVNFLVAIFAYRDVPGPIAWALLVGPLILAATGWQLFQRMSAAQTAAAEEILALRNQHAHLTARTTELTNSQGRFVGNIAHEIKTPLSTVLSLSELILTCSDDSEAVRSYARSIRADTRHLADLVDSFLRLARPFSQADTSHHTPVFCNDIVVEAARRTQPFASTAGVAIDVILPDHHDNEAELEVLGDSVLLEAMVENLVRNAVRFSSRGSRVRVTVEAHGESLAIFIRDRGTGIAPDHLESVFDWFFDSPILTRQVTGVGFGLAIARRVAEHHSGSVSLRNCDEGGCEFAVRLPRWQDADCPTA